MPQFTNIAFTGAVKKMQSLSGSRASMQDLERNGDTQSHLNAEMTQFVRARTSAYIATASAAGQPYIQLRGGEPGFLNVVDSTTLMMCEQPGNHHYITQGNISENPNAMLFLMDYENRRRVKIWGEAFISFDGNLNALIGSPPDKQNQPVIVFKVKAWDENCPKHIPPHSIV